MSTNDIKCPNCGHQFPVEDALTSQAEEKIRKEYEAKIAEQASIFNKRQEEQAKREKDFEIKKQRENELFKERLKSEREKISKEINKQTLEQFEEKIKFLEEDNVRKKEENKKLKEHELQLLRKEQELKEQQEQQELQLQKQLLEKRNEIAEEIRKQEQEKSELKEKEFQKQLEDQKKLVEEMRRKAEQGSMQLQGEVQELALEEMLRAAFPFDLVDEVAKGVQGADAIQTVINKMQQVCGKIIYESKRTKAFSDGWIEKLKSDMRNQQADLAVLVTQTMPKELDQFGQKDGVWVCSFNEVKSLTFVLREMLIKNMSVKSAEENKGDKMELLYGYLTGEDFKQRVEAIVEGFTNMKSDLDREKRAMQKIWKEREKQIEKVTSNTIDMYSSIKGIAGNAIGTVDSLELPYDEDLD